MKKLTIFIVALAVFFIFYMWYKHEINKPVSGSSESISFSIEPGESIDSIVTRLKEEDLIDSAFVFKLYLKLNKKGNKIQAGDFVIAKNVNMVQLADILSNAQNLNIVKVTIIEGLNYREIADYLSTVFSSYDKSQFSKEDFLQIVEDPDNTVFTSDVQNFLNTYKPPQKSLEGFLYPDTYEFDVDVDTKFIIESLLKNFLAKISNLELNEDFYDDLILASIVEKESLTDEEKPYIASVFVNRLQIGMPLQSDATVNYVTDKDNPRPNYSDLKIDSPYNTYKYTGLPPTPICNPRVKSIKSAINPADTDYYFFIHEQTGSGQVHFAETYNEHLKNIQKYLD